MVDKNRASRIAIRAEETPPALIEAMKIDIAAGYERAMRRFPKIIAKLAK